MQQIVARDVPLLHLYYTIPFVAFRKAVFTQWSYDHAAGPYNKQLL